MRRATGSPRAGSLIEAGAQISLERVECTQTAGSADRRGSRYQDVSRARGAGPHAQGARSASPAPLRARAVHSSAGRLLRDRARRVLRHRGAQRQRQEHVAEVPRRDLRGGRGADLVPRANVALHRARRRLQPRPRGDGQRRDERDHARAHAEAGARALRAGDRIRRNSRSSRTSSSRTTPPGCTCGSRSRSRSRSMPKSC